MNKINTAIIGLGSRGLWTLKNILCERDDVNVAFVCDEYEDRVQAAKDFVAQHNGYTPASSTNWRDAVDSPDVDVVVNCTAWEAHIEISIAAMKAGKPVAMEVGGAYTLDDCYSLVDTYKETGIQCIMMENCCFNREEMMALNMAQIGVFGKIVHCDGGYQHDLRDEITHGHERRHYRLRNYKARCTDNYPTHELGPIAKVMDLGNTTKMTKLVSMASGSWGLNDYAATRDDVDKTLATYHFNQGDIVKTMIKCDGGETITLTLDTTLPRCYSRGFTVRGTKAAYFEDADGLFLDGVHSEWSKDYYNNKEKYFEKYDHPLWKNQATQNYSSGHGGMDWLVYDEFFANYIGRGYKPFIDIFDTVSWMAITPLASQSINGGSIPVDIPDFKEYFKKK